jgi:hypothetical protein
MFCFKTLWVERALVGKWWSLSSEAPTHEAFIFVVMCVGIGHVEGPGCLISRRKSSLERCWIFASMGDIALLFHSSFNVELTPTLYLS